MGSYGSPEFHPNLETEKPNNKNKPTSKMLGIVAGIFWCILTVMNLVTSILSLCNISPEALQSVKTNETTLSITLVMVFLLTLLPKVLMAVFLFMNKGPRMFIFPFGILLLVDVMNSVKLATLLIILIIAYFFVSTELNCSKKKNTVFLICSLIMELIAFIYYFANNTNNLSLTIFYIVSYTLLLIYVYIFSTEQHTISE